MKKQIILITLLLLTMSGCLYSQNITGHYTYNIDNWVEGKSWYSLQIKPDSTYVISCGGREKNSEDNEDRRITVGRWKQIDGHVLELTSNNYLNPEEPTYVIRNQNLASSDSLYFKIILPSKISNILPADYYVELTLDTCVITSFKTAFALCKRDYYSSFAHTDSVLFDLKIYKRQGQMYFYGNKVYGCDFDNFIQKTLHTTRTIDLDEYNGFTLDYSGHANSFFTFFDSDHELAYITSKNELDYHHHSFTKRGNWLKKIVHSVPFNHSHNSVSLIGRYINSTDSTQWFQVSTDSTYLVLSEKDDTLSTGKYFKKYDDYFEIINDKDSIPVFLLNQNRKKIRRENKASPDSLYFRIKYPKAYSADLSQLRYYFGLRRPPLRDPFIMEMYDERNDGGSHGKTTMEDILQQFHAHESQNPIKIIRVNDSVNLPHWRDSLLLECDPTNVIRTVRVPESVDLFAWRDSLHQQDNIDQMQFVFRDSLVVIPLDTCIDIAPNGIFRFILYPYLNIALDSFETVETYRRIAGSIYKRLYIGNYNDNANEFYIYPNSANYYTLTFRSVNNEDQSVFQVSQKADDSFCIRPNGDLYFQGSTWKKQ